MARYNEFERHIAGIFNSSKGLYWRNKHYGEVLAFKPATRGSGGECKTDVYVSLRNNGMEEDSIKITIKKVDAEFLANKMTALDAESLLGSDWSSILIRSIIAIKQQFIESEIIYKKPKKEPKDLFFTLGWKLEITNKKRKLSSLLDLTTEEIVNKVYRGCEQPDRRKNALVDNIPIRNSGVADYLLEGKSQDFSDIQSVLDRLIDLSTYSPPPVYMAFTANNYRLINDGADGKRTLAVAVKWSSSNGKLVEEFIFDAPLQYQGETDMMPLIKLSLKELGIETDSIRKNILDTIDVNALS